MNSVGVFPLITATRSRTAAQFVRIEILHLDLNHNEIYNLRDPNIFLACIVSSYRCIYRELYRKRERMGKKEQEKKRS